MKIRIQDNSIRLRVTLREVEHLAQDGRLCRETEILGPDGPVGTFRYMVAVDASAPESLVDLEPALIRVRLSPADRAALLQPDQEGVYIRREWIAPDGAVHRFMAFVEKDRPGSTCVKKEQWIYDAPPHGPVETRPIPRPAAQ
jgi:hypothetical protein